MTIELVRKGRWLRGTTLALAWTCALVATACGSGTDDTMISDGAAATDDAPAIPDDTTTADPAPTTPAVLFAERVDSPDTRQIYVHIVPSVPTSPGDRTKAYEFGSVYNYTYGGMVYIRDREAGTMTRYQVTDDLQLVEDKRADGTPAMFSFQSLGLRPGGAPVLFISPTRAYLFDFYEMRIIVWNPTTMELAATFSVEHVIKPGFEAITELRSPVRVDDRIFVGAVWEDEENVNVHPGTGVLILSATTDTPGTLIEDSRITGAANLFADAAGDVYVVGTQYGGLYNVMGSGAGSIPPAGVLRIEKDATEFDPDYFVDLNTVTGSQAILGTYLVNDTTLAAQLWEPSVDARAQIGIADDYFNAEEFVYGLVDLESRMFSPLPSIPKGGVQSINQFRTDDVLYAQVYKQISDDVRDVEIHAVTRTGTQKAFTVPGGDLWNLERIR